MQPVYVMVVEVNHSYNISYFGCFLDFIPLLKIIFFQSATFGGLQRHHLASRQVSWNFSSGILLYWSNPAATFSTFRLQHTTYQVPQLPSTAQNSFHHFHARLRLSGPNHNHLAAKGYRISSTGQWMVVWTTNGASGALPTTQIGPGPDKIVVTAKETTNTLQAFGHNSEVAGEKQVSVPRKDCA